jgi:SRSO17 transposase
MAKLVDDWLDELAAWSEPFLDALEHPARRHWAPYYLRGLLLPGERNSVQPMAARLGLPAHDQLHNFVASPSWDGAALEAVLAGKADALSGGPDAVLVVDDTALPKKGSASVGVAHQYAGALGKNTNCQVLVSLTLAREEVPMPVALRLFLPRAWVADPARLERAGVPAEYRAARAKGEVALAEIDRVLALGLRFGCVLADAGYGNSALFRQALTARGLCWAVGIPKVQRHGGDTALAESPHRPAAPEASAEREAGLGRGAAGQGRVAADGPAPGDQGSTHRRVRSAAGAGSRWRDHPHRHAPAGRRGLAGRRASGLG